VTETQIQTAAIRHCRTLERCNDDYKGIYHPRNENSKNAIQGSMYKKMGVLSGVSDIVVPCPKGKFHGAYIEIKKEKGRVTDSQKAFLHLMDSRGYFTAVTYGLRETIDTIDGYLAIK
jgi:hypothetical protein